MLRGNCSDPGRPDIPFICTFGTMKQVNSYRLLLFVFVSIACNQPAEHRAGLKQDSVFNKGSFGYDLQFLQKQDSGLVILKSGDAQVIVSPKYQAKVFTSTAMGETGFSFGWIN